MKEPKAAPERAPPVEVVLMVSDLDELLPGVHRVASLLKHWLLGTHQGGVDPAHYLDEFTFRFNRRRSRSRGLVLCRVRELTVAHEPVR